MKIMKVFLAFVVLGIFVSVAAISAEDIDNNIAISYDDGYNETLSSNDLSINNNDNRESVNLVSENVSMYYKNGTKLIASLYDSNNTPLVNKTVEFTINGVTYLKNTSDNGSASIALNLYNNTYEAVIKFNGDEKFLPVSNKVIVNILPVIKGNDLVKYYKNSSYYSASFIDGHGNPLIDCNVTFNIHGVFYTRKTDNNGIAKLNINLEPGEYILTAIHPDNEYMTSNLITVLSTINSENLTKGYRDSNQFNATFLDGQGNPLVNKNVTFNIHGVFYNRTTNENGIAKLNINLEPGEYILTAIHPDTQYRSGYTITVLNNLNTFISFERSIFYENISDYFNITLFNSLNNTLANKNVDITIDTKHYSLTTDTNGKISLLINYSAGTYNGKVIFNEDNYYKASTNSFNISVIQSIPVNYTVLSDRTLFNGEEFIIQISDNEGNLLKDKDMVIKVGNSTFNVKSNSSGIATLNIDFTPNVYLFECYVNSSLYSIKSYYTDVFVFNSTKTNLTPISTEVTKGNQLKILLDSENIPIPDRNVSITVNGRTYDRITSSLGIASLNINLEVGTYEVKYEFKGDSKFSKSSGITSMTVINPIKTSLQVVSAHEFKYNESNYYCVKLTDENGEGVSNQTIKFLINNEASKSITNIDGIAGIYLNLTPGSYSAFYEFEGSKEYSSSEGYGVITIKDKNTLTNGYYCFGSNMNDLNLASLANQGTNTIFLNYYAYTLYGTSKVTDWIKQAHSYGIKVHIWMQVYYDESFVSPVTSTGEIDYNVINSKVDEAISYLSSGVDGIHLDYIRFPGTAYKYTNGVTAITTCVTMITASVKALNENTIVSIAVMPETTQDKYYYGQDISALSKIVDAIVPMAYKGNYGAGTSWLTSTIKWFEDNSQGAEIWAALQTYESDNDITKLSTTELFNDAQTVVDAGSSGVIMFRYGLCNFIDFDDIEFDEEEPVSDVYVSVNDILKASVALKSSLESNGLMPTYITVGSYVVTPYQFLDLMCKSTNLINDGKLSSNVKIKSVSKPVADTGDIIYEDLLKSEYLSLSSSISSFIDENGIAPSYITSSAGNIKFSSLVYAYSRVLNYYANNDMLPYRVYVTNFLDNYSLTVVMMPSSSNTTGYEYKKYVTTWLNYCPKCGFYGTLLINPKGVYEGELTCSYCDADYCGVTGLDKLYDSPYYLTRLSESIPLEETNSLKSSNSIAIDDILDAASRVKTFIESNSQLPNYVVINGTNYNCSVVLYLFSKSIDNLNKGNKSNIELIEVDAPGTLMGSTLTSQLNKTQYVDVFYRTANYIESNKQAPNYASSDVGKIVYSEMIDASSRILTFYKNNKELPNTVEIKSFSETISSLAISLTNSLTTEYDKAESLYNYVRDKISYSFYYNTQKGAQGTLEAKTGNCCDQAQLLVAMCRAVNLTARFVHGTCTFSDGDYGHVWAQIMINGVWTTADSTSTRNSLGVIKNWNTNTATIHGYYTNLPF